MYLACVKKNLENRNPDWDSEMGEKTATNSFPPGVNYKPALNKLEAIRE